MCYHSGMSVVGLRELRQNASQIINQVEAGEDVTVTVSGRAVARIVAVRRQQWTTWNTIEQVFTTLTDSTWDAQRRNSGIGDISDPWAPR